MKKFYRAWLMAGFALNVIATLVYLFVFWLTSYYVFYGLAAAAQFGLAAVCFALLEIDRARSNEMVHIAKALRIVAKQRQGNSSKSNDAS